MLLAGTITGAYGIQGWVKVHALTEPLENFFSFDGWVMRRSGKDQPIRFTNGRRHGRGLIARVEGVETRTEAEQLRGTEIWVPDDVLPDLEAGEYYWHQLEGLKVVCDHEAQEIVLGEVDHLLDTGANDVLVLRPCEESIDERERLIPYLLGSVVLSVDHDAAQIKVSWHPDD